MLAMVLAVVGAVNWGLVGLGGFLGRNLNVVNLLLGGRPGAEWVVYLLVGLSGLMVGYAHMSGKCGMKSGM